MKRSNYWIFCSLSAIFKVKLNFKNGEIAGLQELANDLKRSKILSFRITDAEWGEYSKQRLPHNSFKMRQLKWTRLKVVRANCFRARKFACHAMHAMHRGLVHTLTQK